MEYHTSYQEILRLYDIVFNEKGEIKACGREACKRLIGAIQMADPNGYYGDLKSGMMAPEEIKAFVRKITY